jgi:hypothetical protein
MSNFEKGPPRVEIFIHHHFFSVRPPFLRMLPLCFRFIKIILYKQEHYLGEHKVRILFAKDGGENGKVVFG